MIDALIISLFASLGVATGAVCIVDRCVVAPVIRQHERQVRIELRRPRVIVIARRNNN